MKIKQSNDIWVVVKAESGIPVIAEVFADRGLAKRRERGLRIRMREAYDAVDLFETKIKFKG